MDVGQKIKKYLEDNGISQTFLSKRTGIELPKLNLALNGNRKLTVLEYELICVALNVEVGTFLVEHMSCQRGMHMEETRIANSEKKSEPAYREKQDFRINPSIRISTSDGNSYDVIRKNIEIFIADIAASCFQDSVLENNK